MKTWIKMYPEMLHDRKMRKLTEREQLVFMKLLLLAGQEDKNGVLPADEDIALELYMKVTDVKKSLKTLTDAGLLTDRNGVTVVTNFEKRQETNLTGAEKVARYRERKRVTEGKVTSVTNEGYTCNPNVTDEGYISNEKVTVEEEVEVEEDKEGEEELTIAGAIEAPAPSSASRKKPKTEHRDRGELKPMGKLRNVMLSEKEIRELNQELGGVLAAKYIDKLSLYIGEPKNAKKYTDHYLTVLRWYYKDQEEQEKQGQQSQPKKTYTAAEVAEMMERGEL